MSEQRYTADDYRETAEDILKYSGQDEEVIADMLRQAADAAEETVMLNGDNIGLKKTNALLSVENNRLHDEIAQLKARLEAVVKELEDMRKWCAFACVDQEDVDEILQVARGEGGAK